MLLVAAAFGATLAAQQTGPDVVVEGRMPRMMAGLWTFRSSATSIDPVPGGRLQPGRQGERWERCIADGDTPAILDQLVGQQAMFDGGAGCSRLTLSVERDRVFGSRRCVRASPSGVAVVQSTRFRARIADRSLTGGYVLEGSVQGIPGSKTRWQVTASRVGTCPAPTSARPVPVVAAEPLIRADPGRAEEPVATGPQPGEIDHPPATGASPRAAPPPAGEADDVVVMARKLRVMRLHYASDGAIFRWCHADTSSGDPRIDRIGCALVRACVREGSDTPPAALACYHRKVDTLDPVTGPLPRPVAGRWK